jgi:hypothetical protein
MRRFSSGPRKTISKLAAPVCATHDADQLAALCRLDDSQNTHDLQNSPGRLNLAERLAAQLGEWVGVLPEWWMPEYIPAFAGDTQLAVRCSAFATESAEDSSS